MYQREEGEEIKIVKHENYRGYQGTICHNKEGTFLAFDTNISSFFLFPLYMFSSSILKSLFILSSRIMAYPYTIENQVFHLRLRMIVMELPSIF